MVDLQTAVAFCLASAGLALAPGPDNIFVVTQSALHGRMSGLVVTAGLCTGLVVHTVAVALGLSAVVATSLFAFNTLKIIGVGYVLFLAFQAFKASAVPIDAPREDRLGGRSLYLRGVLMNLTNPKVAIFFLAFLPQFSDPSRGSVVAQLLLLGGLFIVTTLVVFGSIAWASGLISEWLKRSSRAQIFLHRLSGVVFVGLACKLLVSKR